MHEAQSKHLLFLFFIGPKHNPPPLIHILPPPHPHLSSASPLPYITAWTCRHEELQHPRTLSCEAAICISKVNIRNSFFWLSPWCFVLWDPSDARNKILLDQNRKKGFRCHFHFCITQPAVIVVVLFFAVWGALGHGNIILLLRANNWVTKTVVFERFNNEREWQRSYS